MNQEYITVSSLNGYIKKVLENNNYLANVYLKGEISNLKKHTTGHWYFTLKDNDGRINAVMFSKDASLVNFDAKDGMNVLITGRVSAYPASGTYQIYVTKMSLDGIGELYVEFEKLKKKLLEEGLFSSQYKKSIPKYPTKVGVITAPTGAAIKDIISTINRRFPTTTVILFPALVQGKDAAPSVVKQIKIADEYGLDTLIVGRGGGSIEDLWAFNEEIVARAIFECKTPVISAVGHEIDVTISDYVADLRAPTPTGAAEMAVPTVLDTVNIIDNLKIRLNKNIKNTVNTKFIELKNYKSSYVLKNPMSMYEIKMQKLDMNIDKLNKEIDFIINDKYKKVMAFKDNYVLNNPFSIYEMKKQKLNVLDEKLENSINVLLDRKESKVQIMITSLKLLNPLGILEKGYSVVTKNNEVIKSGDSLKLNDEINIRFKDNNINAIVKEIN